MVVFEVKKVFPFNTDLLKEYLMCFKTWQLCMPYKKVDIKPRQKFVWDWVINDVIDFVIIKWKFEHIFTSIQEEYKDHLTINFKDSNHISTFEGYITFKDKIDEADGSIKCLVKFIIKNLSLKDALLNSLKEPFIGIMKADYKKFLDNMYDLLQDKAVRQKSIEECYWVDKSKVKFED